MLLLKIINIRLRNLELQRASKLAQFLGQSVGYLGVCFLEYWAILPFSGE